MCKMCRLSGDCSNLDVRIPEDIVCVYALCFCPYVYSHIKSSLIKQSAVAHLCLASVKRKINGRFVAGSLHILCGLFSHLEGERFVVFLPHKS